MFNVFQLNGSVKLHFFHQESELKQLFTVKVTEYLNTLFLFYYLYVPRRTACVGHSTVQPGVCKIVPNFT
jgi:hypothetical protein